jgi:histone H3/H4
MSEIPLAPVGRLMKAAGIERIGSDAEEALTALLEEYALSIAREAHKLAIHSGRKTVQARDIREAADIRG